MSDTPKRDDRGGMFYYFGRKKRLAGYYPAPLYDQIIEPFAGSGAYSLHGDHWKRDVWLNDKDAFVVGLWRYLQAATVADIEALPSFEAGDLLSSVKSLSDEERLLISLHIGPGKNRTNDVVSKFSRWEAGRRYIAANLHKIEHWTVTLGSYEALPDVNATWFVDPPYQRSGKLYRHHDMDFDGLARWTRSLNGQVIACEQKGGDWLPFVPLTKQQNGPHISHEFVWLSTDNKGCWFGRSLSGKPCGHETCR